MLSPAGITCESYTVARLLSVTAVCAVNCVLVPYSNVPSLLVLTVCQAPNVPVLTAQRRSLSPLATLAFASALESSSK